jgi:hypothetical protein
MITKLPPSVAKNAAVPLTARERTDARNDDQDRIEGRFARERPFMPHSYHDQRSEKDGDST